jgi:peptide/nickel transport system substrate-binding protein
MPRLAAALTAALLALPAAPALAQNPKDTLLVVYGGGINSMDIHGVGTSFESYIAAWNMYDRLLTFGRKTMPDGTQSYDYTKFVPELAESFTIAPDGKSVTFKLRTNATFHDGTPVTADDVKWSYDRAVSVGGFPTFQLSTGSLTKPEQFVVVDKHTFRIDLPIKDKLSIPNMAVPVPAIFNSTLAKKHATEKDPWAMEWMKTNEAGGGAYKLTRWAPGQELILERFDAWKSGPMPKIKRVVVRDVPSAGSRRALMEKGDVDVSLNVPPKDAAEIKQSGKYNVVGVPVENALNYVGFAVNKPPFDNVKVRQAVAWAIPYDEINSQAMFGRMIKMHGAESTTPATTAWPQPFPYTQNLDKAKALLAEAGFPNGFETTITMNMATATIDEPTAVLLQEALAKIGIKAAIEKVPGANFRNVMLKKESPIHIAAFGGWLNFPDYWFYWGYHSQNAVFNTMGYQNPKMDKPIEIARYAEDPAVYAKAVKEFIQIAFDEVPRVPLYQPVLDVGLQKNIKGYTYWFHRQIDFRQLSKE